MNTYEITLPFTDEQLKMVRSGDLIYISGYIYTARDAAHKRLIESLENGCIDLDLTNEVIYYVGPTPKFDDLIIGSAGPTTSSRMDRFTSPLMKMGLSATIGKGERDNSIKTACKKYQGLYLIATGGVGALLNSCITEYTEVMYLDLGPESIKRLKLEKFPVYVGYDTYGNDIFDK